MSARSTLRPAPPLPSCALPHHQPGSRVGFHQWHKEARVMEYHFGEVVEHLPGRRIRIRIRQIDGDLVREVECGVVFPQVAR